MANLSIGSEAPSFCLPDQDGETLCLKAFRGKWVVLYFYPKDNTKGCTLEAIDFTMRKNEFEEMGAVILGVSPDSVESHRDFCDGHGLSITLLSDPGLKVLEAYGVWQLRKMYGREFHGVVRSTFLIDQEGNLAHEWRKVRVGGHVEEVKLRLKELASGREA